MIRHLSAKSLLLAALVSSGWAEAPDNSPAGGDGLQNQFANPPDTARMWTWWFWLGDKVDKASLTADLEAYKAQGMGGVTVYSISGPGVETKGPNYMSPEWRELFKHTVTEADRLNLGVSAMLCSGWNAGGPWIQPAQACKRHVSAELVLTGPQHFTGKLPQPKADPRFYQDLAVQAFPLNPAAPARRTVPPCKTLDDSFGDSIGTPIGNICAAPLKPLPAAAPGTAIDPAGIIELSARCGTDGTLDWEVPPGQWKVLRTGYTLTGKMTSWSSPTGNGLEADPLDAAAMDFQFANAAAPLIEDAGSLVGKVFRSVQIDSWETNLPNWSSGFMADFKTIRGYDPRPYLPALAGQIVGDSALTDRFLYDYRRVVADCVAENYFGRLSTLAAAKGLLQQSEAGGVCTPKVMALDALKNLGRCAIPMGEFWQDGTWVESNQNKNGKQTAAAAHVYGKPIAAAEAFSSFVHWVDSPASLKPTADRAFCEGLNQFFIFSSATHTGDGAPGTEFCAGTHFNRKITWWNQARSFTDYVARCSHLLQQGLFAADVLFYNGDGCPNFVSPKHIDPALGPGYDYDVCNTEVILTRLAVKDGTIVLPDGMNYRLLVLPESTTMPLAVLRKLKDLVAAGMTLIGPPPVQAPGLTDYPGCDKEVRALAAELWGGEIVEHRTSKEEYGTRTDTASAAVIDRRVGKGRVIWGLSPRQILLRDGVTPDLEVAGPKDAFVDWIHRGVGGAEIYFLANRKDRPEKVACSFRVAGKVPELWDPVTGMTRDAAGYAMADGRTNVPLEFSPNGSMFVVFRVPASVSAAGGSNFPDFKPLQELAGPWSVAFDPLWGGPLAVSFEQLVSWTRRPEDGIRYYSGTATYRKVFDLAPEVGGGLDRGQRTELRGQKTEIKENKSLVPRLLLDLGGVRELAEVRLNGKTLGTVWTAPWQLDITDALKPMRNELEIRVTNLWPNRLIGDAALPAEKRLTSTNITFKKNQALSESGLLGPVRIGCVSQ
ncbi:MAG: glycosyl hydrolase [Verrucomicrobiota bacterium]